MQKDVSAGGTIKADSFFPRISRQGRNYSTLVGWLLYRAFEGRTWKLVIATTLSVLHLSTQGAAIYLVYWYGRAMEGAGVGKIPFLNMEVNLKDEPEWLWAVVVASTALFVLSALLLYLSRKQIIDMVEKYYARSLEQLVLLSFRVPDPRAHIATQVFLDYGLGGLSTGCRRGALITTTFAGAITAVVGGLGATVFLLRIDPPFTLLIMAAAVGAALFLYPLTIRAAQSAKEREKVQETYRAELRELNRDPTVEQTATSLGSVDELARVYMMRRRVVTELVFAIEIGITVLIGIVVFYMARQALAGKEQWAIFIAYIGALRMTLNGASQAVRAFASVSRYYPQIVRYYLFVKDIRKINSMPLAEVHKGDRVSLGTLHNGDEVIVEIGERLAMLSSGQIRESMFSLVDAKLEKSRAPVAAAIVNPANVPTTAAGLLLVACPRSSKDIEENAPLLDTAAFKQKVTLIVYYDIEKVGSFGESMVLTAQDGELRRFARLGTEEGDAVLKEFSLKGVSKQVKAGLADDDDEEEDM